MPVIDLAPELWRTVIDVNLTGTFYMSHTFGRVLVEQGDGGSIVNISSIGGKWMPARAAAYAASKAGIHALTAAMAQEVGPNGVRVNAVCPGNVRTPIHTGVTDARWVERMARISATKKDDQAMARMALPQEVAAAVLWLASDAASYVTGHALTVDGGLTAGLPWRRQPAFLREYHPARK